MKNLFKFGFLALAISLSVAACNTKKTGESATDSTAVDSTTAMDTAKAAMDTAKAAMDTAQAKADTTKK